MPARLLAQRIESFKNQTLLLFASSHSASLAANLSKRLEVAAVSILMAWYRSRSALIALDYTPVCNYTEAASVRP